MFIMAVRKRKCRAQTLIVPFCFPISFSSFWRAGFQELFCRDELHITCLKLWRLASEMRLYSQPCQHALFESRPMGGSPR